MEAIQLSPMAVPIIWTAVAFLFILLVSGNDSEWLTRFVRGCALYVIVVGALTYNLYLVNAFLGLADLADWMEKDLIANGVGSFLLFFVFSILWRIGKQRYPNSGVHGLIYVVLLLAALVLGGVGALPPIIKLIQVTGTWLEVIAILLFSILVGWLVTLYIRRVGGKHNPRQN